MIKQALAKVLEGSDLDQETMLGVMNQIMGGEATDAQIGAFLVALRIKGETIDEVTAAAQVMREKAVKIKVQGDCIDTCGTGGDHSLTFNISTATALVAAGSGLLVAKHGNRAASSACGSADVLKELGVNIEADQAKVEECIAQTGIGFLFAPMLHGAMRYAIGPRREISVRTIFNILGPLTNPAGAKRQLLGVFDPAITQMMATVLGNLGSEAAMVVHGSGLDEISVAGPTLVSELKDGKITSYEIQPEDFSIKPKSLEELRGGDPKINARIIGELLDNKQGAPLDAVALNTGAAIYVSGKTATVKDGVEMARETIASGKAREKLDQLIKISNAS